MSSTNFRKKYSLEQRHAEAVRIIERYPERVPIIVEEDKSSNIKLDKRKFLVPTNFTLGQFIYILKKRIELKPEQSIFIFIGQTLPEISANIGDLYNKNKEEDLFLYFLLAEQDSFGFIKV
jgi:GABA(A) receptor-associated protein